MRRHDIVSGILLILSTIDFVLTAPVLVQEKHNENADMVHMSTKDVITVLGKRWEEDLEKLGEEFFETGEKPVESPGSATDVVQPPAPNPASSTTKTTNQDPSMDPSSCSPSTSSKRGPWARGSCLSLPKGPDDPGDVGSIQGGNDGLPGPPHTTTPTLSGHGSNSRLPGTPVPQLDPNLGDVGSIQGGNDGLPGPPHTTTPTLSGYGSYSRLPGTPVPQLDQNLGDVWSNQGNIDYLHGPPSSPTLSGYGSGHGLMGAQPDPNPNPNLNYIWSNQGDKKDLPRPLHIPLSSEYGSDHESIQSSTDTDTNSRPSTNSDLDWNYLLYLDSKNPRPQAPEPLKEFDEAHWYDVDPADLPSISGHGPSPPTTMPEENEAVTPTSTTPDLVPQKEPEYEVVNEAQPSLDPQAAAIYAAKGKAKESRRIHGTAGDVGNAVRRELRTGTIR